MKLSDRKDGRKVKAKGSSVLDSFLITRIRPWLCRLGLLRVCMTLVRCLNELEEEGNLRLDGISLISHFSACSYAISKFAREKLLSIWVHREDVLASRAHASQGPMFQVEDLLRIGFRDRHERRSSTSCLVLHSKNRVSWSFAVSTGEKHQIRSFCWYWRVS